MPRLSASAERANECAPRHLVEDLRSITPPWSVSLPAQVSAVMALRDPVYYAARHRETRALRTALADDLAVQTKIEVVQSAANFILCHLPPTGPDAATVRDRCRVHNLFIRSFAGMSAQLGDHTCRIAVKDAETNRRMVEILTRVLHSLVSSP